MTAKPLTCVIYGRISLDATGQEAGVQRQETECRELAERLGLEVTDLYVDNSISAFDPKKTRPAFEQLLRDAPESIVVWHLDRLVIQNKDLERILELGCLVHAVKSGHLDLSNPSGKAVARTVVAWAHYERELKGERQKAQHRQRRARGETWWHAKRPYGYTKAGEVIPEEAARLREAYLRFLDNPNVSETARYLGTAIGGTRRLLLAERNLGGPTWEPIVDEETFAAASDILLARVKGPRQHVSMLTGVTRCGTCEGPCGTGQQTRSTRRHYRCRLGHVWYPQIEMDEYVGHLVAAQLVRHRAAIEAKIEDTGDELQRLAVDFAAGRMTASDFTASVEGVKRRVARPAAPWLPWEELSDAGRRRMCAALIEAIVMHPRGKGHGNRPLDFETGLEIRWRTPV